MLLFSILYLAAKAVELILARASVEYSNLSFSNKRNTVTCETSLHVCMVPSLTTLVLDVINTIFTVVALAFQLIACPSFDRVYTFRGQAGLKVTATIISALCKLASTTHLPAFFCKLTICSLVDIFEMCYRSSMRLPLIIHHFCVRFSSPSRGNGSS